MSYREQAPQQGRNTPSREAMRYQLTGWILFIISALLYLGSSWKNGDITAFLGSVAFLAACIVFLIPLLKQNPKNREK